MIECEQGIENMIDREDDVIILDGEDPEFLSFKPLSFFKSAALRAMTVLAGFVVELPMIAIVADLQHTAQGRCAAIHNGADRFALFVG